MPAGEGYVSNKRIQQREPSVWKFEGEVTTGCASEVHSRRVGRREQMTVRSVQLIIVPLCCFPGIVNGSRDRVFFELEAKEHHASRADLSAHSPLMITSRLVPCLASRSPQSLNVPVFRSYST